MSFGQSAAFVPRQEVKSILRNQLALRAVQQWVDKAAKPIEVVAVPEEGKTGKVEEAAIESSRRSQRYLRRSMQYAPFL